MKGAAHVKRGRDKSKPSPHAITGTHSTGPLVRRVALPEIEVFTDSADSTEVEVATRDLRQLHDAQVADDDYQ